MRNGPCPRIAEAIGDRPIGIDGVLALLVPEDIIDVEEGAMSAAALQHLAAKAEARQ